MSNNNHGHIGQPTQNPSWNPLQIPSYIPRQPQLAHMSNERPMVRSPLAWHAPAPPPESLYNFMSANHKNLEHQMNPLLPSYVRGPPPFDSMDLSLQSSRNSNSPLNKSGHATALPQHEYGGHKPPPPPQTQQQAQQQQHHQQQQQQTHNLLPQQQQPGSYPIHNLSTNSSPSAIPQQQQQQQQQSQQQAQNSHVPQSAPHLQPNVNTSCPSSPANKYMNANGNDCDSMLPPPPSTTPAGSSAAGNGTPNAAGVRCSPTRPGGNNNVAGGGGGGAGGSGGPSPVHYMRNYENELQAKSMQKPVELVNKECAAPASGGYSPIMGSKMASLHGQVSPKKHPSPMRSSYHGHHQSQAQQQQQHQQSQQQQQQHMSPYNNPAQAQGGKHNGPHTPPTPASPVHPLHSQLSQQQQHQKHATAGGKLGQAQQSHLQGLQAMHAASMDYNQMHLQHANNAYAAQQQQQQQQMQQQQQYHFQQQQQHQQQHHHQQQQQQQHLMQQQQQHYHQQQQHQQANQHQQQHHHQPPQHPQHLQHASPLQQSAPLPPTPTLTNLDALMKHRNEAPPAAEASNAATTTTAASSGPSKDKAAGDHTTMLPHQGTPAYKPPPPASAGMPYGGEEAGATTELAAAAAASSNNEDESLDSSNSNSNSSRMRRKRKSTKVVRMTPAAAGDVAAEATTPPKEAEPKRTPPKAHDSFSPLSPVSLVQATTASKAGPDGKSPVAALENGHAPANGDPHDAGGGKSLERIRDMFAKVTNTPEATHDSNSNGRKTPPEPDQSGATATTGSPKTKKQRQALKLRNVSELHNSNSNCSSTSLNDGGAATGGGGSGPIVPATSNDNAVSFAGELHKTSAEARLEDDHSQGGAAAAPLVRPLSPQSNSRSSSSSSSSSSCSNTTRSSNGHKEAAPQNGKRDQSPAIEAGKKGAERGEEAEPEGPRQPADPEEEDGPLNLDRKAKGEQDSANCPTQSARFEEVENKLEEMFAGIEDEHSPREYSAGHTPSKVNLALELSSSQPESNEEKPAAAATVAPLQVRVDGPPPTKAAKKSTLPSPPLPSGSPSRPRQSPSAAKGALSPAKRVLPPRSRSNSQMEAVAASTPPPPPPPDTGKPPCLPPTMPHDDEQPSTSAAAAQLAAAARLEAHAQAAAVADDVEGEGEGEEAAYKAPKATRVKATRGGPKGARQPKGGGRGGRRGPGGRGGGKFAKRAKHAGRGKVPQKRRHNSSDEEREASTGLGAAPAPLAEPKYRSPFVLVKKDGSVTVINTPSSEEVGGEKQAKAKKPAGGYAVEHKKIRGLHSSTLSTKYDADTTDSSWICVFCKRGPHRMGLGDLFGPYVVSNECEEYRLAVRTPHCLDVDEAFVSKRRRSDMVQTNARNLPVVPAVRQHQSPSTPGANRAKKKKKSLDDVPPELVPSSDASQTDGDPAEPHFSGMCRISESNYEVWTHEDCIIWAPDVFLIGASVMDLDAAVWNSTRQQCSLCDKPGAIVCCLRRDCKRAAHVPCARDSHWTLNEDELKVHCAKHWPMAPVEAEAVPQSRIAAPVAMAEICQPADVTSSYS